MHKKKVYDFVTLKEIEEHLDLRYGARGSKRSPKHKATPEEMAKRNHYNRVKKCRHQLLKYFKKDDYFVTLTCRKDERPKDMKEMQTWAKKFFDKLRYQYRKRGQELYWICNIEVGTRGAWHIHFACNRISDADLLIREAWKYGKVVHQLIYEKAGFRELAEYLRKTPETDSRLKEAKPSASRNMPLDPPRVFPFKKWQEKPRIPKGWFLDKDSFFEGINPVTGAKYRSYTIMRC